MSITDLTSMAKPEEEQKEKVYDILGGLDEEISSFCYQCGKCTSGCEAFILLELEPHRVMTLSKSGFIDELMNSDEIWSCLTCLKCKERCPQDLAPVDVIFALKNLAVSSGKEIHSGYSNMLQSVLSSGLIQKPKEVKNRYNEGRDRDSMELPPCPKPDGEKSKELQQRLMKIAQERLE